jgi:hypothetical protein
MKHILLISGIMALLAHTPVIADTASFEQGATICIENTKDLPAAHDGLSAAGWSEKPGFTESEFDLTKSGTHIYLNTGDAGGYYECAIMDETVSRDHAADFLVNTLNRALPDAVKGEGFAGIATWRVQTATGVMAFIIIDDFTGNGAGISFGPEL